jgi:hypothetical protein
MTLFKEEKKMRNYLFEVGDKKYIVKAENENYVNVLREFFDDVSSVHYLGWCTDEVAEELGYEVYSQNRMTIKDFYKWAVANKVENYPFRAFNSDFGTYEEIVKDDIRINDKIVYLL